LIDSFQTQLPIIGQKVLRKLAVIFPFTLVIPFYSHFEPFCALISSSKSVFLMRITIARTFWVVGPVVIQIPQSCVVVKAMAVAVTATTSHERADGVPTRLLRCQHCYVICRILFYFRSCSWSKVYVNQCFTCSMTLLDMCRY
jgi:hypothetical protein